MGNFFEDVWDTATDWFINPIYGSFSTASDLIGGGGEQTQTATQTTTPVAPTLSPADQFLQDIYRSQILNQILNQNSYSQLGEYAANLIIPGGTEEQTYMLSGETQKRMDDPYNQTAFKISQLPKIQQNEAIMALKEDNISNYAKAVGRTNLYSVISDFYDAQKAYNINPEEFKYTITSFSNMPVKQTTHIEDYLSLGTDAYTQKYTPESQYPEGWDSMSESEKQTYMAEKYPESPLATLMSFTPEKLQAEITRQEQEGLKDISGWYDQAAREMEQRGVTQSGGLMGSRNKKDLETILAKRLEAEQPLKSWAEAARGMAPYETAQQKLGTLQNLMGASAGIGQQQLSPWLQLGQGLYSNYPWGSTTTSTQSMPQPGLLQTLSDLTGIGLGIYGIGSGLGFWGNTATNFGAGLAGGTSPIGAWGSYTSGIPGSPYLGSRMT